MKEIESSAELELKVIVSGAHLSPEFGLSWEQIVEDGFKISAKVEMLFSSGTPIGVSKSIGAGVMAFSDVLARLKPHVLLVLGDRFEAFSISQVAVIHNIPIAHIHGGEISHGSYDEIMRHCITQMASLHFAATEEFRKRIIQLGKNPACVFNVGSLGVERILSEAKKKNVESIENLELKVKKPFFVVCYHPVTRGKENPRRTFREILKAISNYRDHDIYISYPNADNGSNEIIDEIELYRKKNKEKVHVFKSIVNDGFISLLKKCSLLIGNSSSGIIEAPSLKIPTINVGCRQAGRLAAQSVIHSEPRADLLKKNIEIALSDKFSLLVQRVYNPYENGPTCKKIVERLENFDLKNPFPFYDLSFGVENVE